MLLLQGPSRAAMPAPYADPAGRRPAPAQKHLLYLYAYARPLRSLWPSHLSAGTIDNGDRRGRWLARRQNLRATTGRDGWPDGRREGKDVRQDQGPGEWCLVCSARQRRNPESAARRLQAAETGPEGPEGLGPRPRRSPRASSARGKWHLEPRTCSPFASAVAIIMSSARGLTRAGGWRWHRVSLVLARLRRACRPHCPMPQCLSGPRVQADPRMREPARRRGGQPADSFQHGWRLP